jgi:hypothetical protein
VDIDDEFEDIEEDLEENNKSDPINQWNIIVSVSNIKYTSICHS